MAKGGVNIEAQARELIRDIRQKQFKPVYLLMGDEPYYPDLVCQAILDNCLEEWEQDFNQTVCYGSDVDAETVISAARRFPMMATRQLVVVKEAQLMKDLEQLSLYCANPLDSTVFVVLMHRASADKRKAFYKSALKAGVVLDSPAVRDYEIVNWILNYYRGRGLEIDPPAAQLLAESAGTDLGTIVVETDKLLKSLPEAERHAFHHGAHHVGARVAQVQVGKRAAHGGRHVERAAAGERRVEEEPVRADSARLRKAVHLCVWILCAWEQDVAQPSVACAGREDGERARVLAWHNVVEDVRLRARVDDGFGARYRDPARRA